MMRRSFVRYAVHYSGQPEPGGVNRFPVFPVLLAQPLLLIAALWLVACDKGAAAQRGLEGQALSATANTPTSGGALLFAFDGAAITQFELDPHKSGFAPHHRVIRSIFDSLVVALPNHTFGPWLAKSWELSPDGLSYTFKLREDVHFHDGSRFDAKAVQYNLERIKDPKNAFFWASDLGPYEGCDVLDEFSVRVRFREPYAPFLANLSKSSLAMVSPAAAAKHGAQFPLHPVGSGPFVFKSLQAGTEIVLTRNDDYRWPPVNAAHQGPAYLQQVTFKNVPEEATRVAVLLNGQAGVADLIPAQNLLSFRSAKDFHLVQGELLNHNYALYLNTQRAPWTDPRIREAFRRSLEIDAAVKMVYLGTTARAFSPLSPSLLGYDPALEGAYPGDPAAAARTLDELGFKKGADGVRVRDGQRLSLVFLDTQGNREKRLDVLTVLRRQLRASGFEVRIDTQPQGAYLQKVAASDYDLLGGSLFAPDPDVLRRIHSPLLRSAASVSKTDDPELNRLLDDGAHELLPQKRVEIYKQAQRLILERTYAIPIYVLIYNVAASNKVHGISIDTHGFPTLYDTWVDT